MKINTLLDPVTNFGKVTVSTGYTDLDTIIVLFPGNGAKLPNPSSLGPFNLVWYNSTDYSDPSDDPYVEIVRCTVNTLDVLTVTREQEGTLKTNKNIPTKTYKMILSPTKKTIDDINTEKVSKAGDTMTGILNLPSNGLIVGTNQLIVSGGNVGIGTTIPGQKVDITGSLAVRGAAVAEIIGPMLQLSYEGVPGGMLRTYNTLTSTYLPLYVRGNPIIMDQGNVGIGTLSPGYRGDVGGSFRVGGDSQVGASSGYGIEFHPGTGTNQIYAYNRSSGTPLNLSLQEAGGNIFLYGSVGIGTTSPHSKLDITTPDGSVAGDAGVGFTLRQGNNTDHGFNFKQSWTDGRLYIERQNSSSDKAIMVALDKITGNVGIGTTSPWKKLDINGDLAMVAGGRIYTRSGDLSSGYSYGTGGWVQRNVGYANDLDHWGWFKKDDATPLFFINGNSGSVGIGTTTPSAKLHIGGTPGVDGIKFPDGTTQTTAAVATALSRQILPNPIVNDYTNEPNVDDGNEATYAYLWGITNTTKYLTYDLGAKKNILLGIFYETFTSSWGPQNGAISIYLEYSFDNVNWYTISSASQGGGAGNTKRWFSQIVFARYIRITTVHSGGTTAYSGIYIYEISLIY